MKKTESMKKADLIEYLEIAIQALERIMEYTGGPATGNAWIKVGKCRGVAEYTLQKIGLTDDNENK